VANSVGMTAPTAPNKKQKADYDKMSKLSGAKFDKQFAAHMVADHKKDIKEYEKAANCTGLLPEPAWSTPLGAWTAGTQYEPQPRRWRTLSRQRGCFELRDEPVERFTTAANPLYAICTA
jgi:hypothetical protein